MYEMGAVVGLSPYRGVFLIHGPEAIMSHYVENKQFVRYGESFLIANSDRVKELLDDLSKYIKISITQEALDLVNALRNETPFSTPSLHLPDGFILKNFQSRCLNKLVEEPVSMTILSPGTGKSVIGTAAACYWLDRGYIDKPVIWCPSVLVNDWVENIQMFTNLSVGTPPTKQSAKKREAFYSDPSYDVWVLNYERLRTVDYGEITAVAKKQRLGFVFDEVTRLKSRTSTLHGRAMKLRKFIPRIMGLTATPIVKGPDDYYNEWRILNKEVFGLVRDFEHDFTMNEGEKDAFGRYYGYKNTPYLGVKTSAMTFVADKSHPEIACEFPKQHDLILPLELSSRERSLYNEIMEYGQSLPAEERQAPLFAFMLRRLCDCPEILLSDTVVPSESPSYDCQKAKILEICHKYSDALRESKNSNKLALLTEKVDEIVTAGQKAILFGMYTNNCLYPIAKHLKDYHPLLYTGDTSSEEKEQVKQVFKQSDNRNLLLMSDSGAYGLNLQEAQYVIHIQTPYTPAVFIQRSSRNHRIDSSFESVTTWRFLTKDTLEEKIEDVLQGRRELSEAAGLMDAETFEDAGDTLSENDSNFLLGWDY